MMEEGSEEMPEMNDPGNYGKGRGKGKGRGNGQKATFHGFADPSGQLALSSPEFIITIVLLTSLTSLFCSISDRLVQPF